MSTNKREEYFPQGSNPDGTPKISDSAESASYSKWQTSSTYEELISKESPLDCWPILSMPRKILNEIILMSEYLKKLGDKGISTITSEKEFVLKSAECKRVRDTYHLLKKAINRCKIMGKSRLEYFLINVGLHSYQMNAEKIDKIAKEMRLILQAYRVIRNLAILLNNIDIYLANYSTKLFEAKLEHKRRMNEKESKKEELASYEDVQDLVTQFDKGIARTLTTLLNSTETILLPVLRGLRILPPSNLPTKSYSCGNTPESLRQHMDILEKVLSDSDDLWNYKVAPESELDKFFNEFRLWMDDSNQIHEELLPMYLASCSSVTKLKIVSHSATPEEYIKMVEEYNQIRIDHNVIRNLIYQSNRFDCMLLEQVSRRLLEFCDAVGMDDAFVSFLCAISLLSSVSRVYVQFIEDDERNLDIYIKEMNRLELII